MPIKAKREQNLPQTAPFSRFEWQGGEFSALVLLKQQRAKALSYRCYRCPMCSCGRYGSEIAFRSFVSADFQSGLDECKPPMRLWVHSGGKQLDTPVSHVMAFFLAHSQCKRGHCCHCWSVRPSCASSQFRCMSFILYLSNSPSLFCRHITGAKCVSGDGELVKWPANGQVWGTAGYSLTLNAGLTLYWSELGKITNLNKKKFSRSGKI